MDADMTMTSEPTQPSAGRHGLVGALPPLPSITDGMPNTGGLPTPSMTYRPADQGTEWPMDAFTQMVAGHQSPEPIERPAAHSYAGDGNMEAFDAFGPFSHQETSDIGAYTGGVGPAGRSTPEARPELTAPDSGFNPVASGVGR